MKKMLTAVALTFSALISLLHVGCGKDSNEVASGDAKSANTAAAQPSGEAQPPAPPVANQRATEQPNADDSADDSVGNSPPQPELTDKTEAPLKEYVIPDGPPETIMAFVQELEDEQPQGRTEEDAWESFRRIQNARIAGCDKILDSGADEQLRFSAVLTKMNALEMLIETEQIEVAELVGFCKSLLGDDNADIAREARLRNLIFVADELLSAEAGTLQPLLDEVTLLLEDKPAQSRLVEVGQQVASSLYAAGRQQEAGQVMKSIGEALVQNPDLAEAATNMLDQALMIEIEFPAKMQAALEGAEGAVDELVDALTKLMETGPPSATDLQTSATAGQYLEISGNEDAASRIYRLIEKHFKDHSDKNLAEAATRQAEHGLKRLALIGQPFEVTGETVDGQPFDWSKYAGKVVLVDFWATWCGPCIEELPNIEKNYEAFHDKGFEVVGVNLDDDRSAAQKFLAHQQLPWTTVVSADPIAQGFQNPLIERCGIDAIPFLVLVDREGKVTALHVRGPELEARLTELLGQPDE